MQYALLINLKLTLQMQLTFFDLFVMILKNEICLKYFLDVIFQKQPLCGMEGRGVHDCCRRPSRNVVDDGGGSGGGGTAAAVLVSLLPLPRRLYTMEEGKGTYQNL